MLYRVFVLLFHLFGIFFCLSSCQREKPLHFDSIQSLRNELGAAPTDFEKVNIIRRFASRTAGMSGIKEMDIESSVKGYRELSTVEMLLKFKVEHKTAVCDALCYYLNRLYADLGFKAYSYYFGSPKNKATHVVSLVEVTDSNNHILVIEDPLFAYTLTDSFGRPKDFYLIIEELKEKNLADIRRYFTIDTCNFYCKRNSLIGPEMLHKSFPPVYNIEIADDKYADYRFRWIRDMKCYWYDWSNFAKNSYSTLGERNLPPDLMYLLLLKNGKVYNPSVNADQLNSRIDSLLN